MVAIYVRRIMNGQMKLEDVPEHWKADVEAKLNELGYSEDEPVM